MKKFLPIGELGKCIEELLSHIIVTASSASPYDASAEFHKVTKHNNSAVTLWNELNKESKLALTLATFKKSV